jgi:DNA mismatch repair protein MutL
LTLTVPNIRTLPPEIVKLIAAGEVIERPASVVKELIENSLDSGARNIEVKLISGGIGAITVRDDGHGIPSEHVPNLIRRHTTSKISTEEDLGKILSLGFRGEALYSIAAVSDLIISTRFENEESGTKLSVENGEKKIQTIPWHKGTQVESVELFHATPARRKFLRSPSAEYSRVAALMSAYALAYTHVAWKLSHNGKDTLKTPGTGNIEDALIAIYGTDVARNMIELTPLIGSVTVRGAVSKLDTTRSRRTDQVFFLNGRLIKDLSVASSMERAYYPFLQEGRHPVSVLYIECDPAEVDVNVHPHKREVRFSQPRMITEAVYRTVKTNLQAHNPIVERSENIEIDPSTGEVMPGRHTAPMDYGGASSQPYPPTDGQFFSGPMSQPISGGARSEHKNLQHIYRSFDEIGVEDGLKPSEATLQFASTYLIYNSGKKIFLIDQHNLHERILYEGFIKREIEAAGSSQALLFPMQVTLPPTLAGLIDDNLEDLNKMGFEIEEFSEGKGPRSYVLRSVPQALKSSDPVKALTDCLERVSEDEKIEEPGGFRKAFAVNLACKTAIKAGRKLTVDEIEFLIKHIEDGTYYTCPHGRPTIIELDEDWFRKAFKRS